MWSLDAFNKTATTTNPDKYRCMSFFGSPPPLTMPPFLKPGYCRVHQINKLTPKAEPYFYLSGGNIQPRNCVRNDLPPRHATCTRGIT